MKRLLWIVLMFVSLVLMGCRKAEPIENKDISDKELIEIPEEEEKEVIAYDVDLEKELSSYQFSINEKVYQLPVLLSELLKEDWKYEGTASQMVEPESFLEEEALKNELGTINVDIVNNDIKAKPIQECLAGGLHFKWKEDTPFTVQLPGNITVGSSTLDEVLGAYGDPNNQYDEAEVTYVTYEYGIYKKIDLEFDLQEGTLTSVYLMNYREPQPEQEVSRETPQIVKDYAAPEALGTEASDIVAEYAGHFYRVPAPVSEFTKNGWKLKAEGSDASVTAGRHGYVTLEKDSQILYAVVMNYADVAVTIENCFVTTVHGDFEVTKVPITVYKGITLGMKEAEAAALLENEEFVSEEMDGVTHYFYYINEDKKDYVEIILDSSLKIVREITITNAPDSIMPPAEGGENNSSGESQESVEATAMYMPETLPEDDMPEDTMPSEDTPPLEDTEQGELPKEGEK